MVEALLFSTPGASGGLKLPPTLSRPYQNLPEPCCGNIRVDERGAPLVPRNRHTISVSERCEHEAQNRALGYGWLDRFRLLDDSCLGNSIMGATGPVGSRPFDLSDCAYQHGFSFRSQVVLGFGFERDRVRGDRPHGRSAASIAESVSSRSPISSATSSIHTERTAPHSSPILACLGYFASVS